jgi:hypothetical protein
MLGLSRRRLNLGKPGFEDQLDATLGFVDQLADLAPLFSRMLLDVRNERAQRAGFPEHRRIKRAQRVSRSQLLRSLCGLALDFRNLVAKLLQVHAALCTRRRLASQASDGISQR